MSELPGACGGVPLQVITVPPLCAQPVAGTPSNSTTQPRTTLQFAVDATGGDATAAGESARQALFQAHTQWSVIVRALWVSALFAAVPLALAYRVFGRRDVTGE